MNRIHRWIGACLVAVLAAACANDAGTNPSDGVGAITVTLARTNVTAAPAAAPLPGAGEAQGPLDLANVSSLVVEILAVDVRRADVEDEEPDMDGEDMGEDDEDDDDGQWIRLVLETSVALDLLAVPVEGEDPPLVIASGLLEAGTYDGLRLITGDATITFLEPFTVGQSTFDGEHPVMIPSGPQTGLKAQVTFDVTDDDVDVVGILFDQGATIGNAVATGSGMVILTPVLR